MQFCLIDKSLKSHTIIVAATAWEPGPLKDCTMFICFVYEFVKKSRQADAFAEIMSFRPQGGIFITAA